MSWIPSRRAAHVAAALLLVPLVAPACIPYTVGSTAQTVPPGELRTAGSYYVIPDAIDVLGDSVTAPVHGVDLEGRVGITEDTDIGVRLPSSSGVVVNIKHRMWGPPDREAAAVAVMAGAGFVNWGEHAHFELSLIASGATHNRLTPYGGFRVMQVAPLGRGAPHDSPTVGGFLGLRIGSDELGVSPELGVFYDRSTLELRERNVIFVPAITFHGSDLVRLLPRW